jgi:hypothetical protein
MVLTNTKVARSKYVGSAVRFVTEKEDRRKRRIENSFTLS